MTLENKAKFLEYALDQMPREACAILVATRDGQELVLCENLSEIPDNFVIGPKDYLRAQATGILIGIVHSHCFLPPTPSEADRVQCEQTKLPWHILSVPTGKWQSIAPEKYRPPLIGREFAHGVLDCYSLIRDYYRDVLSIAIPDFERPYEWWSKGLNLYLDNYRKAGFYEVPIEHVTTHDVLLMQIHSDVVNHGGVYIGNDQMIHHLNRRLSTREIWAGYYKRHTVKVLRHEDC